MTTHRRRLGSADLRALRLLPLCTAVILLWEPVFLEAVDRRVARARQDVDPWGQPYRIHDVNGRIEVRSCGPDQREHTDDDIVHSFVVPR